MSSTAEELDDVRAMTRVAAGDPDALATLFDRHSPVVLGVLTRMLGQRGEAEEVLQEAFLQVWRQAGRYEPRRGSPRTWLLMLARSRALDRLRANASRARREEEVMTAPEASLHAEPAAPASLEADESRERVATALQELSPPQRECIHLAFFEGLSHSQIADRLAQPLGTVKSRILLGMRTLRRTLAAS